LGRPLRILQLTTFYPPYNIGGSGMYVYRLAHTLGEAGHRVDVIHCIDSYRFVHGADPESGYASHPNVHLHGLQSGYGLLSPLLSHQTGRPLLKQKAIQEIVRRNPPDVIHFHNVSLFGPEILRLKPPAGPVVKLYTAHDHWLYCPTMTLWKFNSRLCEKPECLSCTLISKRPPQFWRYTNLIEECAKEVDLFVAPSRFTAAMHASRGFSQPVKYLPLVIEPAPGAETTVRPHARPYFLFVGRLELVKGLQTLIGVWDKVLDADLLVVGTGRYEGTLRGMAAANSRIRFLGKLSPAQIAPLLDHCIACVVPSIYYETSPTVVIEAFARKVPVIARDLGGLTELLSDSGGGILYQSDGELIAALSRLAGSPALREELGGSGYRLFTQRWSCKAQLEFYFDALRETAMRKFGFIPWEQEPASASAASLSQ
jgi:glycosyltransferase involved in cell wall biosynthesis